MKRPLARVASILVCLFVLTGQGLVHGPASGEAATLPKLDPAVHPHIQLATTDKAVYAPGAAGRVLVTLHNPGSSTLVAQVTAAIYRNTMLVHEASVSASVPASGGVLAELPFTAPNMGERGYRVAVAVRDARGAVRDAAATAIDVQTSRLHARFPRQCWISHWDGAADAAALIAGQIAWHCNTVQSYASYYRPELAPPTSLSSWLSLSKLTVSRFAIRDVIAAAHDANMPVGFFQATGEAYSNWPLQAVRPSLAWGSFRDRCGMREVCTVDDMDRSPQSPNSWREYQWQADHLDFFDPCSKDWQDFLLSRSIIPMMEEFGFDFWQADTVGAPVQPTFDASGRPLDTVRCLTDFATAAQLRLSAPVILNSVSGWGMEDAARNGEQLYLYRETWNFDAPHYPGLNGLVAAITDAMRGRTVRAIVQPAYINRTLAEKCAIRAQTDGCIVNPHAALAATAMFAISGSTWMNHSDQGCILTSVFVEGYQLPCSPALTDALLSYKAFEVAYQNLLRDGTRDSEQPCEILSGGKGSPVGAAGEIYILGKARPGYQICHMLNLTGVSSNDWTDLNGAKEKPVPLAALTLKLHYAGDRVKSGRNLLWSASPDQANGTAQPLRYATGADESGNYVVFTLPVLRYWNMLVLETMPRTTARGKTLRGGLALGGIRLAGF